MELKKSELNYKNTVKKILEFSKKYKYDLFDFQNYNLKDFFYFVSSLEYKPDLKNHEFISRPLYLLDNNIPFRDCDDKTLLICTYLELKKLPKIILISGKNKPEHIFPATKINQKHIYLDATYPNSKFNHVSTINIFDIFLDL